MKKNPEDTLDDEGRQAVVYAMLGMQGRENLTAVWKFANSIENDFKRSHLLNKLAAHASAGILNLDLTENIARSMPILSFLAL